MKYSTPELQFAYENGKLDLYHEWYDKMEQWDDEAEDLGYTDQWQRDSYVLAQSVKFMDAQRAESQLQSKIAQNKLESKP